MKLRPRSLIWSLPIWLFPFVFASPSVPLKPSQTIPLENTGEQVMQVAFSPDETRLISVDLQFPSNMRVSLWTLNGERRWTWTLEGSAASQRAIIDARFETLETVRLELNTAEAITLDATTGKMIGAPRKIAEPIRDELLDQSNGTLRATVGATDHEIALIDSRFNLELGRLRELHGGIVRLKFSPDGGTLAVLRDDGRISLWDVRSRQKRFNLRVPGFDPRIVGSDLDWNKNLSLLFTHDSNTQILWVARSGKEIRRITRDLSTPGALSAASLAPSGRTVALANLDGTIDLIETRSGSRLRQIGFRNAHVVFSEDARTMYVASSDGRLRIFSPGPSALFERRDEIQLERFIGQIALVRTRGWLLFGRVSKNNIGVLDLKTRTVRSLHLDNADLSSVYPAQNPAENPARVWIGRTLFDLETRTAQDAPTPSDCGPYNLGSRPDLNRILCFSNNQLRMVTLEDQTIWSRPWVLGANLFWDASGTFLITDWLKDKINILDARTGKTTALLNAPYTGNPDLRPSPRAVTLSPDKALLVTLDSNDTLRYFDLKSRQELEVPPAMRQGLEVQFVPDGRLLIRSRDGLAFWDAPKP